MAPEAPADTAGPSSPPPRLPEGWLPQWEGVERKWYYVQRTTGKSQWEIPTEPIFLTPSTTPTPIGTGPSPTPTSHATEYSNREVHSGHTMVGGSYSAADSARVSNSLEPQMYGHSDNSMQGSSGIPSCYPNQTGQHFLGGYEPQSLPNAAEYGPNPLQPGPGRDTNGAQPGLYTSQALPGYQMADSNHLGQSISSPAWGNNPGIFQSHTGGYNMGQNSQPFLGFSAGPLQGPQPPASWAVNTNLQRQLGEEMVGISSSQPQWQLRPQQIHVDTSSDGPHMNMHQSNPSQPFFGSYSPHQNGESNPRGFARRSSNTALFRETQPYQSSVGNFPPKLPHSTMDQATSNQSHPLSRSHSQHSPTDPTLQGFSPLQHVQSPYQHQHMIRAHPDMSVTQDRQQYYIQMLQGGVNPFVAQHRLASGNGPAGIPEPAHIHQAPYYQSSHHPENSSGETRRASESHFVSGPWTSTPPSATQS